MLTFSKRMIVYDSADNTEYKYYSEGECLSTDEKPIDGIANGSKLIEMDTGSIYMFDEDSSQWIEWGT